MAAPAAIAWQPARVEKGATELPGTVPADFGTFELRWVIGPQVNARLVTREPAGSAELPLMEKELWPLVLEGGVTAVFQEWFPLLNANEPTTARLIVVVKTADLFSVLADGRTPPEERLARGLAAIRWAGVSEAASARRVRGTTGEFELSWERMARRAPELVGRRLSTIGQGGLPELRLIPWMDASVGNAMILMKVPAPEAGGAAAHLAPLVTVNTEELLRGFDRLR